MRRTHRSPTRPRRLLATLVVATLSVVGVACADDGGENTGTAGTRPPTPTDDLASPDRPNSLGCVTRAPGEPLTRDEAIVRFTPEQVCPGYVTVVAGTPVTFANEDHVTHTVTVQVMDPSGALEALVFTKEVPPGDYIEESFAEAGIFAFTTDALPAFRGTVEVQATAPPVA